MTARQRQDYSDLDDLTLAGLCARRDPDAVRHLLAANNQRLFRAAWSILKNASEAEEAVQAAYLSAFAAMDGFAGRSSLSTWLTRITINEALSRRRAERRRQAQLEAKGVAIFDLYKDRLMAGSAPAAPDQSAAREQLRLLLEQAIARLPDGFRTVFMLREVEGLSVEEVAEALDIPQATVKTRHLRARRKLRQALAPEVGNLLSGTFPFAGASCARLTGKVLRGLNL